MYTKKEEQYLRLADQIAKWIKSKVGEAKAKGVIVGLSGGIDSAVVTSIACRSLSREQILVLAMPCNSNPQDLHDAQNVAQDLGLFLHTFSLSNLFNSLNFELSRSVDIMDETSAEGLSPVNAKMADANLKSRLRMCILYYYANLYNLLVLGTSNKSEITLGYFTKYGDGGVDIEPIGDLYKTEVWDMARALGNIPLSVIEKPPSAGLWVNQTDENEIGYSYDRIDISLKFLEKGNAQKINDTTGIFDRLLNLMGNSSHKRKMPPVFEIDHKEFTEFT